MIGVFLFLLAWLIIRIARDAVAAPPVVQDAGAVPVEETGHRNDVTTTLSDNEEEYELYWCPDEPIQETNI